MHSIVPTSRYLNTNTVTGPYINAHSGQLSVGQVRYNPVISQMEVFDGNSWMQLSQQTSIELTPEAVELLDWARKKKEEDEAAARLCNSHPGLADLKEKYEMFKALVAEEEKNVNG